ncbi:MAG: hypothetical protein AAB225_04290 [Acidobacteriota bacterium]
MEWLAVVAFGALVGTGELVGRYRDAPLNALRTFPAILYVLLNAAASAGALALIHTFGWTFGVTGNPDSAAVRWTQVLVAGFGALALFRTSLFTVRAGDRDIGVGPSSVLQVFLAAADRAVDRSEARNRDAIVKKAMQGVDYQKAYKALPPYCLALMRNVSAEEQQALEKAVALLDTAKVEDQVKARLLGLELINVVGGKVLQAAVDSLGAEIKA